AGAAAPIRDVSSCRRTHCEIADGSRRRAALESGAWKFVQQATESDGEWLDEADDCDGPGDCTDSRSERYEIHPAHEDSIATPDEVLGTAHVFECERAGARRI